MIFISVLYHGFYFTYIDFIFTCAALEAEKRNTSLIDRKEAASFSLFTQTKEGMGRWVRSPKEKMGSVFSSKEAQLPFQTGQFFFFAHALRKWNNTKTENKNGFIK